MGHRVPEEEQRIPVWFTRSSAELVGRALRFVSELPAAPGFDAVELDWLQVAADRIQTSLLEDDLR